MRAQMLWSLVAFASHLFDHPTHDEHFERLKRARFTRNLGLLRIRVIFEHWLTAAIQAIRFTELFAEPEVIHGQ